MRVSHAGVWLGLALIVLGLGCAGPDPSPPATVDPVPVGIPPTFEPVDALVIEGQPSHAMHDHGGPPASLSTARFVVRNNLDTSGRLAVRKVEYLRGTSCDEPPSEVAATPEVTGLSTEGGAPTEFLTVPAGGEQEVIVHFAAVEAATTSCDRFVFRVHFDVDGTPRISLAETHVEREASGPPL